MTITGIDEKYTKAGNTVIGVTDTIHEKYDAGYSNYTDKKTTAETYTEKLVYGHKTRGMKTRNFLFKTLLILSGTDDDVYRHEEYIYK